MKRWEFMSLNERNRFDNVKLREAVNLSGYIARVNLSTYKEYLGNFGCVISQFISTGVCSLDINNCVVQRFEVSRQRPWWKIVSCSETIGKSMVWTWHHRDARVISDTIRYHWMRSFCPDEGCGTRGRKPLKENPWQSDVSNTSIIQEGSIDAERREIVSSGAYNAKV